MFAASGLFYQAAVVPFYAKADSALQPAELIDDVVKNELTDRAQQHRWMYTIERRQGDQTLTKEQVETQYGPLDRLVAIDGVPLNADQRQKEDVRIAHLLHDPSPLLKLKREHDEDELKLEKLMRLLAVAFVYEYAGTEDNLLRVNFRPNPSYDPPNYEARVVHSLAGTILVDAEKARLVRLSGQLTSPVQFGYGLLGRVDSSTVEIKRAEVGHLQWKTSMINIHVSGHLFLFKTLSKQQHEIRFNFQAVPDDLSLPEANKLLVENTHPRRVSLDTLNESRPTIASGLRRNTAAMVFGKPQNDLCSVLLSKIVTASLGVFRDAAMPDGDAYWLRLPRHFIARPARVDLPLSVLDTLQTATSFYR